MQGNRLIWLDELTAKPIPIETINPTFYDADNIIWDILRADLLHPVCSGNKFFKLKYYLLDAYQKNYTMIHTEGGPWSNHIAATAYAASKTGLAATGSIHGGEPAVYSATLEEARQYGMSLQFNGWGAPKLQPVDDAYFIPQGGFGEKGSQGAAEMINEAIASRYTHILCATGTGTMLAGLARSGLGTKVIGIPVLKHDKLEKEIEPLALRKPFSLIADYHFGGYARKNPELLRFMNFFYTHTGIPTDFVYTGKLMYGVTDLLKKGFFQPGSRILTIHSGGLQGNRSLPAGELVF